MKKKNLKKEFWGAGRRPKLPGALGLWYYLNPPYDGPAATYAFVKIKIIRALEFRLVYCRLVF